MAIYCPICKSRDLEVNARFKDLIRVTSDEKPFKRGGSVATCLTCGTVQKVPTDEFFSECRQIYQGYEIYASSAGTEKKIFDQSGVPRGTTRSQLLLTKLKDKLNLQQAGRFLDFGCGTGVTSLAVSQILPDWRIWGFDLDDRHLDSLKSLPSFQQLYKSDVGILDGEVFNLVSLTHVLEHVPDPVQTLKFCGSLLADNGSIFIQVPDRIQNPFDLLVADHQFHFDVQSLACVAARAEFIPFFISDDLVKREITLVLMKDNREPCTAPRTTGRRLDSQVNWIIKTQQSWAALANASDYAVFGTSSSGIWASCSMPRKPSFFVDEDEGKVGRKIDGVPIIAVSEVPEGFPVLVALAPDQANAVVQRLGGSLKGLASPEPY